MANLYAKAELIGAAEPEHYLFPRHGKEQKLDPTRPITSWRSAWRYVLYKAVRNDAGEVTYPGLQAVRFHDARHIAVTTLAESACQTG